jgi:hypoxanthine phosphoribosyltransferase
MSAQAKACAEEKLPAGRSTACDQRNSKLLEEVEMQSRRELLTWNDVDKLIDHLLPQFELEFEAMIMITRGGIVPGGLLAEALNITHLLTAAVDFPAEIEREKTGLFAWPRFLQFPEDALLRDRRALVVDDVWGSGRNITAVKNRVTAAGGLPYTCVLHFNPYRSLFGNARPDYYAAITDAYIVYPWEIDRGPDRVLLG